MSLYPPVAEGGGGQTIDITYLMFVIFYRTNKMQKYSPAQIDPSQTETVKKNSPRYFVYVLAQGMD